MSSNKVDVVGLINPGAMGTPVGTAAKLTGAGVRWVSSGRTDASRQRAEQAGFEPVDSLKQLVESVPLLICVCPPHAASAVANEVAELGFEGTYVDANAVSPDTVKAIGARVEKAGASFVDGSIIGAPPTRRGTTRLYLSGRRAESVVEALQQGHFDLVVLGDEIGDASSLKMAYAAWTKGSDALLLGVRALARARGVEAALLEEWNQSQPGLAQRSSSALTGSVSKAWRYHGEMREIADTFAATGLPDGFHRAAAQVYQRLERFKDMRAPELDAVLEALLKSRDRMP